MNYYPNRDGRYESLDSGRAASSDIDLTVAAARAIAPR